MKDKTITDIEWYESKNVGLFRRPTYINRPPRGYFDPHSPMFNTIGFQFVPDTLDRIIYSRKQLKKQI